MMPQLLALKGLTADNLIVSEDVDSSVMDPETLCFSTNEQMRKVFTKLIKFHSNHTTEVTRSAKYPEGKRRLGTFSLDRASEVLIEDLIEEMQRVLKLDLKTRVDKADIASRPMQRKSPQPSQRGLIRWSQN
jgi:hypothetical protein